MRITARTLEIYRGTERMSSHLSLPAGAAGQYRTNDADLPSGRQYQQWDAPRARAWAERVGPAAVIVVNRTFESVPVHEQGLDAALAVLRLSRRFSAERVEAACALALTGPVRSPRYAHIHPILATARTRPPLCGQHRPRPSRPAGTSAAPTTTPECPMSSIDSETKRKLREMGAQPLLEALEAQHDDHVVGMSFGERLQLVVDHAHESFNHS